MKDSAEGKISVLHKDKEIFYTTLIPSVVCKPNKGCIQIEFLVDTGAHYTMISYQTGLDLGLDSPGKMIRNIMQKTPMEIKSHIYLEKSILKWAV